MVQRKKQSTEDAVHQASTLVEKDFAQVLEEQQENDRILATISSNLARIGKRLTDVGKTLERPETIPSSCEFQEELEDLITKIPALVSQYREHCAKELKIQSQLSNLSWHRS